MITVYGPEEHKSYYEGIINKTNIKENLKIHTIENGCVVVDSNNENFGVFDKDNTLVPESISSHRTHAKYLAGKRKKYKCEYIDCEAVYCGGGMAIQHFGHLLVEGINRIYPFFDNKYKNCKFVFASTWKKEVPSYVPNFLKMVGIPSENIMFLRKPVRFKRVYIPDEAFDWTEFSSREMADMCRKIADNIERPAETHKKLYVSRLKTGDRRTFGEEVIQKIFEKNGYKVIYPEQLSIEQQIGLANNCEYLAGAAGTALHLALFMKPGGTVIQIKRNNEVADNFFVQNLINQTIDLDYMFIWGSIEKNPTQHFTKCPQIIGPTKYFVEFLDAMKFKYSKEDLIIPDSIIAEYETELAKYKKKMGSRTSRKIKKFICRIFSCFIPGRHNRKVVREFFERLLRFEKDY